MTAGVPEIAVVVPTLNRWRLLERTIAMVLGQRDVDVELVVVDDGSTDETAQRLAGLSDPRVRCLRHPAPTGVATARNDGLAEVRAPWVAFLDDDDLWAPDKLRRQLDAAGTGGDIVYASSVVVDEHNVMQGHDPAPPADTLLETLLRHNAIPGGCSNLIARTELVRSAGAFDPQFQQLADWDLWIRLVQHGHPVACAEALVGYVDHPSSMHVRDAGLAAVELERLTAKHGALALRHGALIGGGQWYLNWVAGGQYRAGDRRGAFRTYMTGARRYRSKGAVARAVVGLFSDWFVTRDIADSLRSGGPTPDWLLRAAAAETPR